MRIPTALRVLVPLLGLSLSLRAEEAAKNVQKPKPEIEVCFVLDTTGSMGGLIEGAKVKIWSIANSIVADKPVPHLKIALVAYRDRGDAYITKVFDLTEDLDAVFKNIQSFKAEGGGDEPESVNQALDDAVNKVGWSADRKVTKIIFLVGDAPPHMDYQDDKKYPETCKEAVKKDLIINTIQCGSIGSTTTVWKEIAKMSEGSYVALPQEGGMVAVVTPVDGELAKINDALNGTVVPYGSAALQKEVAETVVAYGGYVFRKEAAGDSRFASGLDATTRPAVAPEAMASRLSVNAAAGRVIQGRGDLLFDLKNGTVKLDAVKAEDLPEELKKMSADERAKWIEAQQTKREELQKQLAELSKKREIGRAHV